MNKAMKCNEVPLCKFFYITMNFNHLTLNLIGIMITSWDPTFYDHDRHCPTRVTYLRTCNVVLYVVPVKKSTIRLHCFSVNILLKGGDDNHTIPEEDKEAGHPREGSRWRRRRAHCVRVVPHDATPPAGNSVAERHVGKVRARSYSASSLRLLLYDLHCETVK